MRPTFIKSEILNNIAFA